MPSFILEYLNGFSLTPTLDIIKKQFLEIFEKYNDKLKNDFGEISDNQGACVKILLVYQLNNFKKIFSINLGDSRQILIQFNNIKRLSYDHRMCDPDEKKRIR